MATNTPAHLAELQATAAANKPKPTPTPTKPKATTPAKPKATASLPAGTVTDASAIAGVKQTPAQGYNPLTGAVTPTITGQTDSATQGGTASGNTSGGSGTPAGGYDTDAYAKLMGFLNQWGLGSLSTNIIKLLSQGYGYDEALTKIKYDNSPIDPNNPKGPKWNDAYNTRFAGNVARVAAGLNAYDEGTYLEVENAYEETLRKYGLNNLISTDAATNQKKWAEYMANDIARTEFAERIQTVADRVLNMDPAIKRQFQTYYPSLTNTDLVSYFLDPKETLPVLKNKVTAAEIGAAAYGQGFAVGESRAMEFAKFGVSRDQAITGYSNVAEVLPTSTKLSDIYNEEGIKYGQTQAEDEFLKQDAQAKLKRNRLASKERAMFAGDSGVGQASFGRNDTGVF